MMQAMVPFRRKGSLAAGAGAALLVLFFSFVLGHAPVSASSDPTEIHVSGEALLTVNPDQATVVLAVETQAPTAPEAQEANAVRMAKIREALGAFGLEREAFSTANFRLSPVWQEQNQSPRTSPEEPRIPRIVAYRVSHDLRVRVQDIERLGEIIDAAVAAGADRVSHIDFSLRDAAQYRDGLLESAYADARAKAEALARAAGLVIIGPAHISEGAFSPFSVRSAARTATLDMAVATEIAPGEQQLSARIDVVFLAEPR